MNRVLILGASRGLGAALVKVASDEGAQVFGVSRKEPLLTKMRAELANFDYMVADFTRPEDQTRVLELLDEKNFHRVFYIAGGGPYGKFGEMKWSAHEWTWDLNFHFPARLLHHLSRQPSPPQMILVGSSVAESEPDPLAASYCAAKHALKGLYSTLCVEMPMWDLRLFSPGYMDTEMIPRNAAPRKQGVYDPVHVARDLWLWSLTPEATPHKIFAKHPRAHSEEIK